MRSWRRKAQIAPAAWILSFMGWHQKNRGHQAATRMIYGRQIQRRRAIEPVVLYQAAELLACVRHLQQLCHEPFSLWPVNPRALAAVVVHLPIESINQQQTLWLPYAMIL
jgi:hypothetical protein